MSLVRASGENVTHRLPARQAGSLPPADEHLYARLAPGAAALGRGVEVALQEASVDAVADLRGGATFEAVYRRYAPALQAFCAGRLGNTADAEDACHEAMLKAHRALPRFRPGAPMWPWLATIAANVCIDMQRQRPCDSLDAVTAGTEAGDDDPYDLVTARLRRQLVDDAIGGLPERYRAPVYLADIEGWSYAEIAKLEGTTVTAVRGVLHRGRAILRDRIAELLHDRRLPAMPAAVPMAWSRLRAKVRAASSGPAATDAVTVFAPSFQSVAAGLAAIVMTVAAALPGTLAAEADTPPSRHESISKAGRPAGEAVKGDHGPGSGSPGGRGAATPVIPTGVAAPPSATTDVDVEGERRGVDLTVSHGYDLDGDGEPDEMHVRWTGDCENHADNTGDACDTATTVIGEAAPPPEDPS